MKTCSTCKEQKRYSEFNKKSGTKDGYQYNCRECSKRLNQKSYEDNRQHNIERVVDRRNELAERLQEHKRQCGCCKCPEREPCCLEFHHEDDKEFNVSQAPFWGYSWDRIEREIAKCIVVCSNCHKKIHAGILLNGVTGNTLGSEPRNV